MSTFHLNTAETLGFIHKTWKTFRDNVVSADNLKLVVEERKISINLCNTTLLIAQQTDHYWSIDIDLKHIGRVATLAIDSDGKKNIVLVNYMGTPPLDQIT